MATAVIFLVIRLLLKRSPRELSHLDLPSLKFAHDGLVFFLGKDNCAVPNMRQVSAQQTRWYRSKVGHPALLLNYYRQVESQGQFQIAEPYPRPGLRLLCRL